MQDKPTLHLDTNIKYLRVANHESQETLGKVINKGFTAIGNYEKGIRTPDYMDLYKIAEHYNVSIDDLLKKDLRFETDVKLDENHKIDLIAYNEQKKLSEEDKEYIVKLMEMINQKK